MAPVKKPPSIDNQSDNQSDDQSDRPSDDRLDGPLLSARDPGRGGRALLALVAGATLL